MAYKSLIHITCTCISDSFIPLEKVAIKIIDKGKLDDQSRKILSREIMCMEQLSHRNIIRLFEVIETFSHLYLVMECAAEGDIQNRVNKEGPFSDNDGKRIFVQIASAIHYMVSIIVNIYTCIP